MISDEDKIYLILKDDLKYVEQPYNDQFSYGGLFYIEKNDSLYKAIFNRIGDENIITNPDGTPICGVYIRNHDNSFFIKISRIKQDSDKLNSRFYYIGLDKSVDLEHQTHVNGNMLVNINVDDGML